MASSLPLDINAFNSDPPTDFEVFVAQHRGLPTPEAARLLVEWVADYQPQGPSPWQAPQPSA